MSLFLSHRGESEDAPENTMQAYQLAMDRDSDGIELDIRLTADNEVVCCHDKDLLRVANSPLLVAESTLPELQKFYPVPRLADVLQIIKPGKQLQIELKGTQKELLPEFRHILNQWSGDRNYLTLTSFQRETIKKAADYFPDLPRVLLINLQKKLGFFPGAAEVIQLLGSLHCTGISFCADLAADSDFVAALQACGLKVICWGVSEHSTGMEMADLGVDAMTCNSAVALRALYNKQRNQSGQFNKN